MMQKGVGGIARVINLRRWAVCMAGVTCDGRVDNLSRATGEKAEPVGRWGTCGSLRKLSFDCFYFLGEIGKMVFS